MIVDDAADAIALAGVTAITAQAVSAARFAMVCTVTGFTLARGRRLGGLARGRRGLHSRPQKGWLSRRPAR